MADEPLAIRGIHWRQTFPFTHLFRGFRVAVHPSKMFLAMAMLILLYIGGCFLDLCWTTRSRAVGSEIADFESYSHAPGGHTFDEHRRLVRQQVESEYAQLLLASKVETDPAAAAKDAERGSKLSDLKKKIIDDRNRAVSDADTARKTALAKATGDSPAAVNARRAAEEDHDRAVRDVFAEASSSYSAASAIRNFGLFDMLFEYQSQQVNNVVRAVRSGNWSGEEAPEADAPLGSRTGHLLGGPGVVQSVVRFFTVAPLWLLTQHPLYFFLFGIYFLILWAVFGGAICRIAAVHVARDEKLSVRSALVFSAGKFLSFLCAPIIPLLIVGGIGLLVTLASLLGNIPGLGPVIMGLTFILALIAGVLMTVVLLGLIGGFNLMYPTIAVEGSDSFDAISRAFSYLYARPWRLAFYTAVSVVYGAVTYLFVRLFVYLTLVITHKFVALGLFVNGPSTLPLLSAMWPSPETSARLSYDVDGLGLTGWQEFGAWLIWAWVHAFIAFLAAFVVCFYFSSNTIIYYLMRQEVDATDLDDVYLDQYDDEFADPMPADPMPADPAAPVVTAPTAPGGADADVSPPT
jgi:hypothetical protein